MNKYVLFHTGRYEITEHSRALLDSKYVTYYKVRDKWYNWVNEYFNIYEAIDYLFDCPMSLEDVIQLTKLKIHYDNNR